MDLAGRTWSLRRPLFARKLAGHLAFKELDCIAPCDNRGFLADFYRVLCARLDIDPIIETELPDAVSVHQTRSDDQMFVFVMDLSPEPVEVRLDQHACTDLLAGATVAGVLRLEPYGIRVLSKE